MRRRLVLGVLVALAMTLGVVGTALAAPSPNGPGQPGAPATTCGSTTSTASQPAGFVTQAFIQATNLYAGSPGTPSLDNANSPHAISQYDIACFQVTTNHP